ncbi:MAG TPA: class I SAM-dependent methyltransferase [Pyrinomonadaceae bacterium]|nr:class I SAM-dependent methyltransferase [Pyrinomonadaceae bacterium]
MNALEKALMNNPVRALLQRRYEAPLLERLGGHTQGMRVLEVGCGRGVGTEIIFRRFGAREVHAFDLDPEMVNQARRRLSGYSSSRLKLAVGDATAIMADDRSFDAVFDFGIIHHVPDWQKAVSEISRVLRRGGRFFFMEATRQALERRLYRKLFVHPTENRFSKEALVSELEAQGIIVGPNTVERFFGDFVYGVGAKAA